MDSLPSRPHYASSGRIDVLRFVFWILVAAVPIALLAGYLLSLAFRWGFYILGLAPLLAGALAAGGVWIAVRLGKCRNRWVGLFAGLLMGLVMYLSYYHFDFVSRAGMQFAHRVDVLPRWMLVRILTDEQKKVGDFNDRGGRNAGANLGTVDLVFKWVFFAMDVVTALVAPIGAGWAMASMPFCERQRRWLTSRNYVVHPGSAQAILDALSKGTTEGLSQVTLAAPGSLPQVGELRFDYLPDVATSPIYLTLSRSTFQGKNQPPRQEKLLSRAQLTPEESSLLSAAVSLPRTGEAARALPVTVDPQHVSGLVMPLPPEEAGKVITSGFVFRSMAVQGMPLAVGLGGAGALGWLAYRQWGEWPVAMLVLVLAGAGAVLVGAVVYLMRYEHYLPTRMLHRRFQKVLRTRAETFVESEDPEAVFIEIVPRANWPLMMANNASDVGLVKIDARRRAILFEGDRERWAIPSESVISCQVEEYTEMGLEENRYNLRAVVVLVANLDGRPWEVPMSPKNTEFRPTHADLRRRLARDLQERVQSILPPRPAAEGRS